MTSPLLALFLRSVKEDARSGATYVLRVAMTAGLLAMMYVEWSERSVATAMGLSFLTQVIFVQFVGITLVGAGWFATALADEREEGTLLLLRMTNLNPLSILLGKSTSRYCSCLLVLAAGLPFALLAVTLGGVAVGQVLAAWAMLAAYTFWLCNLALFCSLTTRHPMLAAMETIFGAALVSIVGFALARGGYPLLGGFSPFTQYAKIFTVGFAETPVGWPVASSLALGVVFFGKAWLRFSSYADAIAAGQEEEEEEERNLPANPRRNYDPPIPVALRPPRAWDDAVAWKDFYLLHSGRLGMGLRLLGYFAVWMGCIAIMLEGGRSNTVDGTAAFVIASVVMMLDGAYAASLLFHAERRDKTWPTLALLPAGVRGVLGGKVRGALRALLPGLLTLVFGCVALLLWEEPWEKSAPLHCATTMGRIALTLFSVVYLSLWMRRGALVAGLLLYGLSAWASMEVASSGPPGPLSWQFCAALEMSVYVAGIVVLWRLIPRRAEEIAEEG